MKKNAHLHILIETSKLNKLKKEAEENGVSLGHWCRKKLRKEYQLDRIENKLDKLMNKRKKQ